MQEDENKLLTRAEVEVRFGLSRRFLEVAAVKGNGPSMIRLGRAVRYRVGDIRSWIDARKVQSTSQEISNEA